jgi:hypothetical protein
MHARTGKTVIVLILVVALTLAGCQSAPPQPTGEAPTNTPEGAVPEEVLEYTRAVETISAQLTQNAAPAQPEAQPPATEEPLPPTSTPLPTKTPLPSDTPPPSETPLPANTPIPLQSPTPTTAPEPEWQLAFSDDFTSARFWSTDSGDKFNLKYTAGGYSITTEVEKDIVFSVRSDQWGVMRVETTAAMKRGGTDSFYGVICNFFNGGNYYIFAISPDGWYGIGRKLSSQLTWLTEGRDLSGAVRGGGASNAIRGDCNQGVLTLWVNGVKLATAKDNTFFGGNAGLGVGNRSATLTEVLFDDFFIYTPPE